MLIMVKEGAEAEKASQVCASLWCSHVLNTQEKTLCLGSDNKMAWKRMTRRSYSQLETDSSLQKKCWRVCDTGSVEGR